MTETTKHICRVGTARIDYRKRAGERVLNTTIKSGRGLGAVFAPTWDMVMQWTRNEITWEMYQQRYTALMRSRFLDHRDDFLEALNSAVLIVCCYCQDTYATTQQCHRYLLVEILEQVAQHYSIGFESIGEVSNSRR